MTKFSTVCAFGHHNKQKGVLRVGLANAKGLRITLFLDKTQHVNFRGNPHYQAKKEKEEKKGVAF